MFCSKAPYDLDVVVVVSLYQKVVLCLSSGPIHQGGLACVAKGGKVLVANTNQDVCARLFLSATLFFFSFLLIFPSTSAMHWMYCLATSKPSRGGYQLPTVDAQEEACSSFTCHCQYFFLANAGMIIASRK